tara:strand:+ start:156 stop:1796 length:1641 start_codon:yes stop_codon:yes gene_type:complete
MAIQRIQRFGTYTPSPIDQSRARKMEQLAGLARSATNYVRTLSEEEAIKKAPEEAIADVKKAEETDGEVTLRGRFDRGAELYNSTLQQAYVNSKEISFNQANAKLAAEFKNDLTGYTNAINSHKEVVLSNLDDNFKNQIEQNINAIQSQTSARIYANEVEQNLKEADEMSKLNIDEYIDYALTLANEGQYQEALEAQQKINKDIDERVKNNQETPAGAQAIKNKLSADIDAQAVRYTLDNLLKNKDTKQGGIIAANKFIKDFQNTKSTRFTVKEKDTLLDVLRADVSQFISIDESIDSQAADILKAQQEKNATNLLIGISLGTADDADVLQAAATEAINFSKTQALLNVLSTRGQGIDDYDVIIEIQNDIITNPEQAQEKFEAALVERQLSGSTAEKIAKSIQDSINQESILQTSKVKRFREVVANQFVTKGEYGKQIEKTLQAQSEVLFVFDGRVLAGEKVEDVAKDLMRVVPVVKTVGANLEASLETALENYDREFKNKFPKEEDQDIRRDSYLKDRDLIRQKYADMENYQKYQNILESLKGEN